MKPHNIRANSISITKKTVSVVKILSQLSGCNLLALVMHRNVSTGLICRHQSRRLCLSFLGISVLPALTYENITLAVCIFCTFFLRQLKNYPGIRGK